MCESRSDYHSAAASYRLARCALKSFADEKSESHLHDVSINLARSLCMVIHFSMLAVQDVLYSIGTPLRKYVLRQMMFVVELLFPFRLERQVMQLKSVKI